MALKKRTPVGIAPKKRTPRVGPGGENPDSPFKIPPDITRSKRKTNPLRPTFKSKKRVTETSTTRPKGPPTGRYYR